MMNKTRGTKSAFQNLFPKLMPSTSAQCAQQMEDALHRFIQIYTNFEFDEEADEQSVSTSGEDWTMTVRGDMDENLDVVYEALITTYCPRVIETSGYHKSPTEALIALSKQINRAKSNVQAIK